MHRLHSNRAAPASTPPKKQEGYAALSSPHQDVDSLPFTHLLFIATTIIIINGRSVSFKFMTNMS